RDRESIVAVHSVDTAAGGGGVRWYELQIDKARTVTLRQQGTYAPDGFFRWMASPAIDRGGNIGIGYSFGGAPNFAGQRFARRLARGPRRPIAHQRSAAGRLVRPDGAPRGGATRQSRRDRRRAARGRRHQPEEPLVGRRLPRPRRRVEGAVAAVVSRRPRRDR